MEEDNRPSDTIPAGSDVKPAEGDEKVSGDPQAGEAEPALSLADLNAALGRQYKTVEDAVKGVKETYDFVGKEKKVEEASASSNEEIEALKTDLFFTQNPDLEETRPLLEALAKANGQTIREAAQSDVFQGTLKKFQGAAEAKEGNTVMEGGRRFDGGDSDVQKEFTEAVGNREKMAAYVLKNVLPTQSNK